MRSIEERISELLHGELHTVYCYNCEHKDIDSICEYCHRKSMEWALSEKAADEFANRIMEIINEN